MQIAVVILVVGLLVFLAHAFSALFERTRIPDVLPLVVLGLFLGPIAKMVSPQDFGRVGPVFTTVALVIILFEGGLGLDFKGLREAMGGTLLLTVGNFVATTAVVGAAGWAWMSLPMLPAFTLGAIVGGTSSAVVIPLVSKLRMQQVSRTILVLESTFSDVLCIVVTLGLLEAIRLHDLQVGRMAGHMLASFLMAALIGIFAAILWDLILTRIRELQNSIFTTPAFVFILYGVTELLSYSGAIAALAFGIILGNIGTLGSALGRLLKGVRTVHLNETERAFFAEIVFLIKTFFFVYIGLSIQLTNWWLVFTGLALTLVIFLLRIPVVRLAASKQLPQLDAALMAVIVPKGLAAAVLATLPAQQGVEKGDLIQGIVYAVILFSIILTALMAFWLEKMQLPRPYRTVFASYAPAPEIIEVRPGDSPPQEETPPR